MLNANQISRMVQSNTRADFPTKTHGNRRRAVHVRRPAAAESARVDKGARRLAGGGRRLRVRGDEKGRGRRRLAAGVRELDARRLVFPKERMCVRNGRQRQCD